MENKVKWNRSPTGPNRKFLASLESNSVADRSAIVSDISSPTNDVYKRSPLFHPSRPLVPSLLLCNSFSGSVHRSAGLLGRIRTILDAGPPSARPLSLSMHLRWRFFACVVGGRARRWCRAAFVGNRRCIRAIVGYVYARERPNIYAADRWTTVTTHRRAPGAESSSERLTGTARYG